MSERIARAAWGTAWAFVALGQVYVLIAFPLDVRDEYLGAGPAAWAWLLTWLFSILAANYLISTAIFGHVHD